MERIAVLASHSFAGSYLVDLALQQGFEVLGISRSPHASSGYLPFVKPDGSFPASYYFQAADLNKGLEHIITCLSDFQPHYIFDYAGQGMVAESWLDPQQWFQTNVVAKIGLHQALRKFTFLKKYVRASTPEVYGSCNTATNEQRAYNPSTPYAVSHAAIDLSLKTFVERYQFPAAFTRCANFYGPGQQLYRIIPRSIVAMKTGQKIPLHGGGHSIRSFLHARDAARASLLVAQEGRIGEVYHVASDEYLAIRQLVTIIAQRLGVSFDQAVEITEDRPSKDSAYYLDTGKIRSQLGWRPQLTLEQGLTETIVWVENNLSELAKKPRDFIYQP